MSPRDYGVIGAILLFLSMCSTFGAVATASTVTSTIADHYPSAGSRGTYTCTGTPTSVADDIAARRAPTARATDSSTGSEYLRYRRNVVTVIPTGPDTCTIRVEDLRGVNNGSYVFLGTGFTPSSPSNSSGGSSGSGGSGGGVK